MKRYVHVQLRPASEFDPRSFRTISPKPGRKITVGCPRGQYRSGHCQVGTRAQRAMVLKGVSGETAAVARWRKRASEGTRVARRRRSAANPYMKSVIPRGLERYVASLYHRPLAQAYAAGYALWLLGAVKRPPLHIVPPVLRRALEQDVRGYTGAMSNPLTEREHDSIMLKAVLDGARADQERDPYNRGMRTGAAIRGRQIAKEYAMARNPRQRETGWYYLRHTGIVRHFIARPKKGAWTGPFRSRQEIEEFIWPSDLRVSHRNLHNRNPGTSITKAAEVFLGNPAEPAYPKVYHDACNYLVQHGAHGADTKRGRALIAAALRAIRTRYGKERAQAEARHLRFIAGDFPRKKNPSYRTYQAALSAAKKLSKKLGCEVQIREV